VEGVVCFSGEEMAGRKSWRSRGREGERAVVWTPGPLDLIKGSFGMCGGEDPKTVHD
jgi:hypothetical protein